MRKRLDSPIKLSIVSLRFVSLCVLSFVYTHSLASWENKIIDVSPKDNATTIDIATNLVIKFENPVITLSGILTVYDDESNKIYDLNLISLDVTGLGTNIITINPTQNLTANSSFYITISSNAFGNGFEGITDNRTWNFSTSTVLNEIFNSTEVGDKFKLFIFYPTSFDSERTEPYPVIYFTDGNWGGDLYERIPELMKFGNIPDAVLVGIGYPNNQDPGVSRVRDYLLSTSADKFFQFLKKELLPYIEQTCHTDANNRTLLGGSYGGHFTTYAILQYKDPSNRLFRNVVAGYNFRARGVTLDAEKNNFCIS